MLLAVPTETAPYERRVAAVPETVAKLRAAGCDVVVQSGAGILASYPDDAYAEQGAEVVPDAAEALGRADAVAKVAPPEPAEVALMRPGAAYVGFLPTTAAESIRAMAARKVDAYSLDLLPRISRAQGMDALSSQATVAGYRAALVAAGLLPRFLPMLITAAGTVPPARVLVLGAGVAGLQAIATAKRLGAVVSAYDVRAAAADEVRSLGAKFLELELSTQEGAGGYARVQDEDFLARQRELIGAHVAASDAVITTALVPGRPAPRLVTAEMVRGMRPGSVVVDLAAETGGNCELAQPGETVDVGGVRVWGARNIASSMPVHASMLYARNLANLVQLMVRDGAFAPDPDDEIVSGTRVTADGEIVHPLVQERFAQLGKEDAR
ncbi:MAG: Re/Si-specific NAD(P)(+) transhydrogenase subunit alpha [Frankiaceae bacterium]